MNLFSPFPLDATQAPRWHCLQRSATVALFLLPALMLSIPSNVLVFGWLLLLTSLGGIDCLWRARLPAKPALRLLTGLALAVVALGMVSAWGSDRFMREADSLSRFLALPWALLWVCALRPSRQACKALRIQDAQRRIGLETSKVHGDALAAPK